jgi:undecaprenyl-diphosphatase
MESTWLLRVDLAERRLCLWANARARRKAIRNTFRAVSRLGDGLVWYALMAAMPWLDAAAGWRTSLQMLITGAVGLAVYKLLKRKLVRERPFIGLIGIECMMPPLDRYSFPSGHTLYAVLFTALALPHVPALGLVLVPLAILIAFSRVVLGLHYPTDVLVGAALGAALAWLSNQWLAPLSAGI